MPKRHAKIEIRSEQPFALVPAKNGLHRFGGPCDYRGAVPDGSNVSVHLLTLLDLSDEMIPFEANNGVTRLPLLYPIKFGCGGSQMQYAVVSNRTVEIVYISDPADPSDEQYVQVDPLPELSMKLRPYSYEEARYLTFMREDGHFQPNNTDQKISRSLGNDWINIGGRYNALTSTVCRNPNCDKQGSPSYFRYLATVNPIPVNGKEDFWYEFEGSFVDFHFLACYFCNTIITFNRCS